MFSAIRGGVAGNQIIGDQSLLALWNFDGIDGQTDGTFLADSSLGGTNKTLVTSTGAPEADTNISVDDVPGNSGFNSSFLCNGSSSLVAADANPPDLNFGTGDYTIAGWIYLNGTQTNFAALMSSGQNTLDMPNGGDRQFRWYVVGLAMILTGAATPLNTWQHIAAVRNGNTFTLYQDGTATATDTNAGSMGSFTPLIGENNSWFLNGNIDSLAIWNRAVWTTNFTRPTAPPDPLASP